MDDLHGKVMNILCLPAGIDMLNPGEVMAYKLGHRDARHEAAELVTTATALSQPAAADEVKAELVVAAKRALNVLKGMGNTPNPKNALGALEAAIAKATL